MSEGVKGGFKWQALGFDWIPLTARDRQALKSAEDNIE